MAKAKRKITWLDYRPSGRALDLEVFPFDDLRNRATRAQLRATYRYTFHQLVCVTGGRVTQLVDFEPIDCAAGSLLVLRPGQVHSFGSDAGWEGWLVIFRSEFLPSASETVSELIPALGLDRLPDHLMLPAVDLGAVTETIVRMQQDATGDQSHKELQALLRYQLCALLLRLTTLHDRQTGGEAMSSRGLQRFAKFRWLVEDNHTSWHRVGAYADALGCTERSLTRAALEATGRTAKDVIAARIVLEARRLLAYTQRPVFLIADDLGFQEATNFTKFFRRETGVTPLAFRQQYGA